MEEPGVGSFSFGFDGSRTFKFRSNVVRTAVSGLKKLGRKECI